MSNEKGLGFPVATAAGLTLGAISAKDKIGGFFKDHWKLIVGAGAVGVAGWLVYQKWFKETGPKVEHNPNFPPSTITSLEAAAIANVLYDAMKNPGTDEEAIFNGLRDMTYNDFVLISDAFGKKSYNTNFGAEPGWDIMADKHNLYDWLLFELKENEFSQIKLVVTGKP